MAFLNCYAKIKKMKKGLLITLSLLLIAILSGFSLNSDSAFDIGDLYDTQRIYETNELEACALGETKTYMDYRTITSTTSQQYRYISAHMEVDERTGFLLDEDSFIGVALGSYFGGIGDKFYITLDTGIVLPVIKIDEKADQHTDSNNCAHRIDGSVVEFVIDSNRAAQFFGSYGNGLVLQGNFSNYPLFKGSIEKIEKATDEKKENYVVYKINEQECIDYSIFDYASGY